jgi:hypothetical protein
MKKRYFVIGSLPEGFHVDAFLIRFFAERNDWVSGVDTFLHDVTSVLGADGVILGGDWCGDSYAVALLAAARACHRPVLDASTMEHSVMITIPWGGEPE